ncbi:hypothetical protein P8C59_007933 [Phyllachora maydis]|uniref:Uncharacterized protein n=1 Tax=Phyllachora maydis TaxID=1825666 RepID=A0AAD9IAR2_9PEZI|nr:hypothetical protein P8C59_007933 [Phyllachora maydis]
MGSDGETFVAKTDRAGSVDMDAVNHALRKDRVRQNRGSTPTANPSRKRQRIDGDRFIPNRSGQDLQGGFNLLHDEGSPASPSKTKKRTPHGDLHFQRTEEANQTFSSLLRGELFENTIPQRSPPNIKNYRKHHFGSSRITPLL